MLRQFFHISNSWFEKAVSISYPEKCLLTHYAEEMLDNLTKYEFMTEKFDENLHFKIGKIKCGRIYCHDMGLPCPYSIRLLRFKLMQKIIQPIKKDSTDIAKNEDDLLKITFFHDHDFYNLFLQNGMFQHIKKLFLH